MLEETPSVIYPLLVSKKKTQKSPNNSSDGSDTTICRASQIVESVYLEVIYWEAVGKKKKCSQFTPSIFHSRYSGPFGAAT